MSKVVDRDEVGMPDEAAGRREAHATDRTGARALTTEPAREDAPAAAPRHAVVTADERPAQVEPRLSEMTEPRLRRQPTEAHHGKTVASWTGAMLTLLGAIIGTVGFLLPSRPVVIAGFVVVAVALIATVTLRALGFGQPIVEE